MTKKLTRPVHKVMPVKLMVRESSTGVSEIEPVAPIQAEAV